MAAPENAALQAARNTPRECAHRKSRWAHRVDTPDWLVRPIGYGAKQVRSVEIVRDRGTPYASIRFTHGTWVGMGARTYGELLWDVAKEIERQTGLAWRKGPQ